MIYYNTQGISSANDLIQIMNIGNQPYSSLSLLATQAYLMQSELPTAPNVFDTDYQLVLFTKKLLQRDISTVRLSKEPLSHSYLKANFIVTIGCIAVATYCNSNMGFKIFDSHARDLCGRGQPQGT